MQPLADLVERLYETSVEPARGLQMTVARYGVERYLRGTLARIPADARAFADPEVAAAFLSGAERLFFHPRWSEASFYAEVRLLHEDWPAELGEVACPVTLIHGEQDANPLRDRARVQRHAPRLALCRLRRRGPVRRPRALARRARPDRSLPCADTAAALTEDAGRSSFSIT